MICLFSVDETGEEVEVELDFSQRSDFRLHGTSYNLPEFGQATRLIRKEALRDGLINQNPTIRKTIPWSSPIISNTMGCHPKQVAAFNERARVNGTGVKYLNKDEAAAVGKKAGSCSIPNRQSRNRELAVRDMHDNDAGYGDRAPQNL